ncbi:MAG: hypothetical protein Q9218_006846 [Villophora microphyllina]
MEMCIINPNSEEELEEEAALSLYRLVSIEGSSLLHATMDISDSNLLHGASYGDRNPDAQRGANYLGNQYAEIDHFYEDSVSTAAGSNYTHSSLNWLMATLRGIVEAANDPDMRGLLLQACQSALARRDTSDEDRDLYLGPIAVNAAFLEDSSLFSTATTLLKGSFNKGDYSALGALICLQNLVVQENDCLYDSETVCEQDASTIVDIILEREDTPFSQFLLYQGVRIFVSHFQNNSLLTIPLVLELFSHLNHQGRSKSYLDALLRKIIGPAISNYNLRLYATYNTSRIPAGQNHSSGGSREQRKLAGPIKAFYEYTNAHNRNLPPLLLQNIESNGFLFSLLSELIPAGNVSSLDVQRCIRSLISRCIIQTVGHEPKKTRDWTRLGETVTCPRDCVECSKMNTFLKDPRVSYHVLDTHSYHFEGQFHNVAYFDVEKVGWNSPTGVTETLKWWEEQHSKWKARVDSVMGAIRKRPQDRLKECLGHDYDDIMNLRMIKVVDDAVESNKEEKEYTGLGSGVPQKRVRENS